MRPNGESRLNRIEGILDGLAESAQRRDRDLGQLAENAKLQERNLDRLTGIVERLAEATAERAREHDEARKLSAEEFKRIADVQREGDEKLNALMQLVDEVVRRRPRNADPSKPN